jgi:hypothetical protein
MKSSRSRRSSKGTPQPPPLRSSKKRLREQRNDSRFLDPEDRGKFIDFVQFLGTRSELCTEYLIIWFGLSAVSSRAAVERIQSG